MSNVDWSKAPEGATHWMPESQYWQEGFWKREGEANYFSRGGEWEFSQAKPFGHPALVKRPAAPQWNGEGLPPVGCECEVLNGDLSNAQWEKCTILFVGAHRVVYDSESCSERVGYTDTLQFRPIKTPEQLAAEARERAVDEMWSVYWQPHATTAKEGLGLLYDAGYRKQEQPE